MAKDDNQDAAEPKKENKKNDEQMDQEDKEKIHEQGDEVWILLTYLIMFLYLAMGGSYFCLPILLSVFALIHPFLSS